MIVIGAVILLIVNVHSEVRLTTGVVEKIKFDGDVLILRVDNFHQAKGLSTICFGSTPDATSRRCPNGYAVISDFTSSPIKTFTYDVNCRKGRVENMPVNIGNAIHFDDDGSLRILLAEIPATMTMTAANAEKFVPTTTTTTTTESTTLAIKREKKENSKSMVVIGVIVGLVILTLGILASLALWYFCCRGSSNTTMATNLEEGDQSMRNPKTVAPAKLTTTSTTKASDDKGGVTPATSKRAPKT